MNKKKKRSLSRARKASAIRRIGKDILHSPHFSKMYLTPHHGKVSVARHSLHVAEDGYRIAMWLKAHGIPADPREVVRACLLHDIGMSEDKVYESPSWKKAYTHPKEGWRIAMEEFGATPGIEDAITHHMWPICAVPPRHLTGWIVLAADKLSSMREVLPLSALTQIAPRCRTR